jgi:ArsR family transcriptional regulator
MVASALSTKKAVALFHALSDETRLELLDHLKGGEQCVCELMDSMKAAQSRLSFHLKKDIKGSDTYININYCDRKELGRNN